MDTAAKPSESAMDSAAAEILSRLRRSDRSGCGRSQIEPAEACFDIVSVCLWPFIVHRTIISYDVQIIRGTYARIHQPRGPRSQGAGQDRRAAARPLWRPRS